MPHDEKMLRRANAFGSGSESYERYRPTYPDELVYDVLTYAGQRAAQGVLDIGAGTGKATMLLARSGLPVTALEPASEMGDVLRRRADEAGLGDLVTVRHGTFESLTADDGPFGLVVAAQSFHWTDPDTRWQRLVNVLAPGGTAAMFWNSWALDDAAHDYAAIQDSYAQHGPGLIPDTGETAQHSDWPSNELVEVLDLVDHDERSYTWSWHLPREDYLALLATTSQYAVMPEAARGHLFNSLRPTLGSHASLRGRTLLTLMRRASRTDTGATPEPDWSSSTGTPPRSAGHAVPPPGPAPRSAALLRLRPNRGRL
ncbi:MAG: class I SAM-dependent methyltransferase [Marmoricola sp.]